MDYLYLDTETYSDTPINCGTYKYAEKAEVLLFACALNDQPVRVIDCTTPWGVEDVRNLWQEALARGCTFVAHNSMFDRNVIKHALGLEAPLTCWYDTMVQAMAHSLPGSLDMLSMIYHLSDTGTAKQDGKRFIQLFCKPSASGQRRGRDTHPDEWDQFIEYASCDVVAMRELHKQMPTWNYRDKELALWHLDQRINDRGFALDVELAHAAISASERAKDQITTDVHKRTGGSVNSVAQRDAMLRYILAEYGVDLPDLSADTLRRRVMDEHLPDGLRELLALRLEGSLTSNAKYLRAVRGVTSDGALKGTLQFAGALRTARWAGRLFQPQNLPRPTMPKKDIADGIKALKLGVADLLYPSVPRLTSNVIRGLIIPRGGHRLHVADLSNIEGRGLAALSGESWKLRAFAESDADKTKPDLYKAAYARSFGVDAKTVTDAQRQIGKVQELALGYEGGVGAFITMAATYRMDLQALAEAVHTVAPVDALKEAAGMWEWAQSKQRTLGLDRSVYVACETLKALWRAAHPNVVRFWKALKESSILAVENPGAVFEAGALKIKRENNWLRIRLPSGRYLSYLQPRVVDGVLSYVGVDSYTRSWKRIKTYGGKLAENATQAWARDIMAHNMPAVEQAGYNILLTVHDELITEAPVSRMELNYEGLAKLLAANPPWAADVPLKASGFSADRYEKG